jgi:hypothetical protein
MKKMKHLVLFENFKSLFESEENVVTDSKGRCEVRKKPDLPNDVDTDSKAINWIENKILKDIDIPIIEDKYELYRSKKKGNFPEIKVVLLDNNDEILDGGEIPEKFNRSDLKWLSISGISYIKGEHKNTKKIGFYPNYIQFKALKCVEIKKTGDEDYSIKLIYRWYNLKITSSYRLSPDEQNYENNGKIKNSLNLFNTITRALKGKEASEIAKNIFGENLVSPDPQVSFLPEQARKKISDIILEKSSPGISS